jgi:two-component system, OmpR family, response regulator
LVFLRLAQVRLSLVKLFSSVPIAVGEFFAVSYTQLRKSYQYFPIILICNGTLMSNQKRILYVEDEADIQMIAKMTLEMLGGYVVCGCSSGVEALQNALDFLPDLILLDVMLPEMDGPEILRQLRLIPELAATPAVFMTAKVNAQEISKYLSYGAKAVISKPFEPLKLSEQIQHIFTQTDC